MPCNLCGRADDIPPGGTVCGNCALMYRSPFGRGPQLPPPGFSPGYANPGAAFWPSGPFYTPPAGGKRKRDEGDDGFVTLRFGPDYVSQLPMVLPEDFDKLTRDEFANLVMADCFPDKV
jgi:hypothetical protein